MEDDRKPAKGNGGVATATPPASAEAPAGKPAAGWRRAAAAGVIALVAAGWMLRSGETFLQLRDLAWDYRTEWTDRFEELGARQEQTALMEQLRAAALAKMPADPRRDPAWTYFLFERRFRRVLQTRQAATPHRVVVATPQQSPSSSRETGERSSSSTSPGSSAASGPPAEARLGI